MKDTTLRRRPGLQASGQLRLAGIDGCRSGWIMALSTPDGPLNELIRADTLEALIDKADVIAIDMPMGLRQGLPRRADAEARAMLGPRRSSVFSVPHRDALRFADYQTANQWSKATGYGGIMKQAWNLVPKMREAAKAVALHPTKIMLEAHPELAFKRLSLAQDLAPKRTALGQAQRLALLRNAGLDPTRYLETWPRSKVSPDDILDACVLTLTANHCVRGTARYVPAADELDHATAQPMRIWY